MRYFFHISYNGYDFRGWQRQPNVRSIQEVIEDCLSKLLKQKTFIMGCGRTDALVHSSQFFFHTDLDQEPDEQFLFALQKMLPQTISIHEAIPASPKHHAQHGATARTYDYFFHVKANPFIHQLSSFYQNLELKTNLIDVALKLIVANKDFAALCVTPARHTSTICEVFEASYYKSELVTDLYRFRFKADHFLRGMIRIMVGKLFLIGTEQLSLADFASFLSGNEQPKLLNQAYPQGLYLSKIEYPFLDCDAKVFPFGFNEDSLWTKLSGN